MWECEGIRGNSREERSWEECDAERHLKNGRGGERGGEKLRGRSYQIGGGSAKVGRKFGDLIKHVSRGKGSHKG